MKAFVDENVCPDVFSLDTGVAVATEEVAAEFEDGAREACDGCPVQAISIEE